MVFLILLIANLAVCLSTKGRMHTVTDSLDDKGYDCIIVLGCGVWGDTPTMLLSDRLDAAIELYKAGVAPKLLMSGDHGRRDYDEVNVMRQYALDSGVPSEDIFMDHAGFSTYETMYRAKDIFGITKAVVVTQEYHLYRALYDASAFDIEAVGTVATGHTFAGQTRWEIREALARVKDLIWCILKPEPTYRGDKIDIRGNGIVTAG
jgi:vancomycin permeability regulator SanA